MHVLSFSGGRSHLPKQPFQALNCAGSGKGVNRGKWDIVLIHLNVTVLLFHLDTVTSQLCLLLCSQILYPMSYQTTICDCSVYCVVLRLFWRRKWQPTPVFLPEEPGGGGDWWAAIYGVTQSRTRLKRLSSNSRLFGSFKTEKQYNNFTDIQNTLNI